MKQITYITLAALVLLPLGALLAIPLTQWIAGFKPRFKSALLSTALAFVISHGVVWTLFLLKTSVPSLGIMLNIGSLTCLHFTFLKSETGTSLTGGKAFLIALFQVIASIVCSFLLLLVAGVVVSLVIKFFK
jgi:hypothetical protein